MAQATWLVVALGNPLVGADGFGAAVLAGLRLRPDLANAVDLLDAHTDLLGHLDALVRYDEVILVDALLGAGRHGEVALYDERQFMGWPAASPSCHQISPLLAVKLLRQLHPGASTRIVLLALSADEISAAMPPPSESVTAAVDAIADLIGGSRSGDVAT
jgi:hydrogenase maturation protease